MLGYLPLAIAQTGATISAERFYASEEPLLRVLERFVCAFETDAKKLLASKPYMQWEYGNGTVFTTWEVSFTALERREPNAARLFLQLAFLDRERIPGNLLLYRRDPVMTGVCLSGTCNQWLNDVSRDRDPGRISDIGAVFHGVAPTYHI